jgi:hypothetical protein
MFQFHGFGTMHFNDGQSYTGHFAKGCKHGLGTHEWPSGRTYQGEFRDDKIHGTLIALLRAHIAVVVYLAFSVLMVHSDDGDGSVVISLSGSGSCPCVCSCA